MTLTYLLSQVRTLASPLVVSATVTGTETGWMELSYLFGRNGFFMIFAGATTIVTVPKLAGHFLKVITA